MNCVVCGSPGTSRCRCRNPPSVFCNACYTFHMQNGHYFAEPSASQASALQPSASQASQPLTSRQFAPLDDDSNLEYTRLLLISSLEEAQQARTEAQATFQRLIRSVYQTKARVDAELARAVAELSQLVESYTQVYHGSLAIDRIRLTSRAADLPERLRLLSWCSAPEEFEVWLQSAFTFTANTHLFEEESPEQPLQLEVVPFFGYLWEAFYVQTGFKQYIQCPATQQLKACSAWVHVSSTDVFFCGELATLKAYLFNMPSGECHSLQTQLFVQCRPGLGKKDEVIYIFGGSWKDVPQRYCERFSLRSNSWSPLPSMQFPRHSFTPALEKDVFYLLGGFFSSTGESFDTHTQTFRTLNLEMNCSGRCLALPYDGDLIVLLNDDLNVWEKKWGTECLIPYGPVGDFSLNKHIQPYRSGDLVYITGFSHNQLQLYELDLSTKKIAEKTSSEIRLA